MRRKVLVVEDDPDQLEVTRLSLKAAGFAIGTASNGIDALKKAQTVSPDLILLDVMMPGMDGFAVCETLRENPATASIPVLMLTGLCSHISQLVAFDAGATDYLIKPFVPEELAKSGKAAGSGTTAPRVPEKSGYKTFPVAEKTIAGFARWQIKPEPVTLFPPLI